MTIHTISTAELTLNSTISAWAERKGYALSHINLKSVKERLPKLWETDLLVVIGWDGLSGTASEDLIQWFFLLEICGRPILRCETEYDFSLVQLQELSQKPRTNYRPVDCGYYDHFEEAIVTRRPQRVQLTCFGEDKSKSEMKSLRLLDTKTWRKEEFVEVEGHGWMRADWVKLMDVQFTGECLNL